MAGIAEQTKAGVEVWNGLEDEVRRAEISHWRGAGKWRDDERWRNIGIRSRRRLERLARDQKVDLWSARRSVLEWGPGGGANLFAFKDVASAYYGVDISERNLAEASRMISAEGFSAFRPVLIRETPEEVRAAVAAPVDVFLSTAVFQHFPSKAYGLQVLKVMSDLAAPGALGLIQIRFEDEATAAPDGDLARYKTHYITATSYRIDAFGAACAEVGLTTVFIDHVNPVSRYATFYLRKA